MKILKLPRNRISDFSFQKAGMNMGDGNTSGAEVSRSGVIKSRLLLPCVCLGLSLLIAAPVFAGVIVTSSANVNGIAAASTTSPPASDSATSPPDYSITATAAVSNGDGNSSTTSAASFNVMTDLLTGIVTITGTVSSSANAQDFNNVTPHANGDASLSASIQLTSEYTYLFTTSGSASATTTAGGSQSGAASVGFLGLGDSSSASGVSSDSFTTSDSGSLGSGIYSLAASANSSASILDFNNNTSSAAGAADFQLELTPTAVPEPSSIALLLTGGMLTVAGFVRRRRRGQVRAE